MDQEINVCPFCGAIAEVEETALEQHYVVCTETDECGMEGPFGPGKEEAIEKWNMITINAKEED